MSLSSEHRTCLCTYLGVSLSFVMFVCTSCNLQRGVKAPAVTRRAGSKHRLQCAEGGKVPSLTHQISTAAVSVHSLQAFIEAVDWEKLQQVREDARLQEEQEHQEEAKEFHAEFGSDEEIYSQAKQAAAEYLSELGVEEEEEDQEEDEDEGDENEAAREPTEEEWDDAPGMLSVEAVLSAVYIRILTSLTTGQCQIQYPHSLYCFLPADCICQQS